MRLYKLITFSLFFISCITQFATAATYEAYPVPETSFQSTSTYIEDDFNNLTGDTSEENKGIVANINMGMTFIFGDTSYTQLGVVSDGYIKFDSQIHTPLNVFENQPIPYANLDAYIAPVWDDLVVEEEVSYGLLGSAPNRRFVVFWDEMEHSTDGNSNFEFQVILYETTREIRFIYNNLKGQSNSPLDRGGSATIGLEIDNTDYTQYSYNTPIPALPNINPNDNNDTVDLDLLFTPSFPAISSINYSCGSSTITLNFAAAVPSFLAGDASNYSIDNSATVNSATIVNSTTVNLNVSGLTNSVTYTVSARWKHSTVPDTDSNGDPEDVEKNTFICSTPQFPTISSALANCDSGAVEVNFSSAPDSGIIGVLANYSIDNGITISSVTVVDTDTVTLATNGFTPSTTYQLSARNTADSSPTIRTINFSCIAQFPTTSTVVADCSTGETKVTFSSSVAAGIAGTLANYAVDNGITVSSVTVDSATQVTLATNGYTPSTTYQLTTKNTVTGSVATIRTSNYSCSHQFPTVSSALANCDDGEMEVNFSSAPHSSILGTLANYSINNGITVASVTVVDSDTVTLSTNGFTPSTTYQLSVQNVAFGAGAFVRTSNFTCAPQFPTISGIIADCNSGAAVVTFSSNVDAGIAAVLANYGIDNSITISSVNVDSATQVTLSTNGFTSSTTYQLTAKNTASASVATVRTSNFSCQAQFPTISSATSNCNSGNVTVDFSSAPDSGIIGVVGNYSVDNGITVSGVTVVDTDTVTLATNGFTISTTYQVTAKNAALGGSATVRTANFTCVAPDFPDISSATTDCGAETVTLVFNSNVDATIANDTANYTIDNGVTVVSAVQQATLTTIVITTSGINSGIDYTLTAKNAKGGAGAAVEIITFNCNNSPGVFSLYKSFAGNLTYRVTGNTLRAGANGTGNECTINSSSSRSLTIPNNADTTIKAAYLYWAGSGQPGGAVSPDFNITFNSNALSADRVFYIYNTVPDWRSNVDYFAAFKDVTGLGIVAKGTNTYTFGDLAVDTNYPWDVGVCVAGWALAVIYEESGSNSEPFRVVNVYDGFDYFYDDNSIPSPQPILDLVHTNFLVGDDNGNGIISGQITHVTWDGDAGNTSAQEMMAIETGPSTGVFVRITDDLDFGPSDDDNDPSDVDEYNSTYSYPNYDANHNFTGSYSITTNVYGADIDTYYISGNINTSSQMLFPYNNQTGFTNRYQADRDLVLLSTIVISVTNKAIADIEIFKTNASTFTVGGSGSYNLRVQNNGDGTPSGSGTGAATGTVRVTDTMPTGLTITLPIGNGGDSNWNCTASTTSAVDCSYNMANYTGGSVANQLSPTESLPTLTVNVSVAGSGTFPNPTNNVTNIARVVHTGGEFDNVNEGVLSSLTAKTPTNNNVDSVVTTIVEPSIDHYAITLNKTDAVSCEAITVTVTAHESHASGSPATIVTNVSDTMTITANVSSSPKGTWYNTSGSNVSTSTGVTSHTFSGTNSGIITFHYNNIFSGSGPEVTSFNITSTSGTTEPGAIAAEDPSLTLNRAGFRFYHSGFPGLSNGEGIPAWIAGMPSNQSGGTLTIQAIKTADLSAAGTNVGACIPLFDNATTPNVTIQLAAECKTPTTCYTQSTKPIVVNSVNLTPANDNGGSSTTATFGNVTLNFDSESKATITMRYDDVGLMELHARYDIPFDNDPTETLSGVLMTGSSNFIVKPFGFDVDFDNDRATNPQVSQVSYSADENGSLFKKAGQLFNVTVSSVMWEGADDSNNDGIADSGADLTNNTVTAKFGLDGEGVTLTHALLHPTGGATSAGTLGGTTVLAASNFYDTGPTVARGTATVQVSWSEVGIMNLSANLTDSNYLGGGVNVTGIAANVGRFIPDHFEVAGLKNITDRSVAAAAGCTSTFTHMGEAFDVDFTLTAKTTGTPGTTVVNYSQGQHSLDFAKLVNTNRDDLNFGARDTVLNTFFLPASSRWVNAANIAWSSGVATITGTVTFGRDTSVDGPFENFSLVTQAADSDGATIGTGSIDFDLNFDSTNDSAYIDKTKIRFGRIRVLNSFGPEIANLDIPLVSEYWDGTKFVINSIDVCTEYKSADLTFVAGSYVAPLASGDTSVMALTTDPQKLISGQHNTNNPLRLSAPGDGNHGSVDVKLTVAAWLKYDWDGGGAFTDDPTATATFGRYRGHDRVIYWHEITQ